MSRDDAAQSGLIVLVLLAIGTACLLAGAAVLWLILRITGL